MNNDTLTVFFGNEGQDGFSWMKEFAEKISPKDSGSNFGYISDEACKKSHIEGGQKNFPVKIFRNFQGNLVYDRINTKDHLEDWVIANTVPTLFKWEWHLQYHVAEVMTPAICLFMPSYDNSTTVYYKAFEELS